MRHFVGFLLTASLTFTGDAKIESGLKPGQKPGPYSFQVVTGPQRGQLMCYVCETADKPMVIVFARELTEPLGKLAAKLDRAVADGKPKDVRGWLTVMGEAKDREEQLVQWGRKHVLKSLPLGIFADPDGPPAYKLHKDAQVTVIVAKDRKAIASFGFRAGELNDKSIGDMMKAVDEMK